MGIPAQVLYEQLPTARVRLVDLRLEGYLSPALELQPEGTGRRDAVVAELECRTGLVVSRITVNDPAFATSRGIGVGATVAQLRAAYGPGRLISGEGSIGIRVAELEATFVLAVRDIPDSWYHTTDASVIPSTATIRSILLN